ncbi:MAG: diguanylate cyclase [Pseudomonadales bacterium]|nr:diguanylate cyclase [Pseudomonadales bacterium]
MLAKQKPNLIYIVIAFTLIASGVFAQSHSPSIVLTDQEKNWLLEHPVIPVASDPLFPPVEFYDDQGIFSGISADFLSYIGKQLGVEFKAIRTSNWSDSVALVRSGAAYMLSAELKTSENERYYAFSKAYARFPNIILARENVVRKQSYEDLSGKRLAVVSDYPDMAIIKEKYPDIKIIEVKDVVTGLRATAFGQTDAMIIYQPVASYNLQKEGIANLHVVGVADFYSDTSFAVNKEYVILKSILDKALEAMPDEEKQRILNRWVLLKADLKFDYSPLIKIFLGASLIILLLAAWIFQSQHQKKRLQREIQIRRDKEEELNQVMGKLQEVNRELKTAVITDPLTGVMNRRGFYELMSAEHNRMIRYGGEIALLILDIDHFKMVNDRFGHNIGDRALRKVTEICTDIVRTIDVISRIGGEEFAILLPNTSTENATVLAERIRASVANITTKVDQGIKLKMTISIGVASYVKGDTPDSLLNKADQALYIAKNKGRNQVICHDEIQQTGTDGTI